jgi:hypothetical protein
MVGIEPAGLESLPEGPGRDLVLALHALYRGAGNPSTRRIAKGVQNGDYRDTVSHETVAAMLHGDRGLPRWEKLEAVVSVLALLHSPPLDPVAEATRMQGYWHAAQGHASLGQTARDLASTPAAMPLASGVIEAPAAPARPAPWEFSAPPALSGVLPRSRGRSARQFLLRLGTLWSRVGQRRSAAIASVAVAVCIAGAITGLRLTDGAVASESFRITAAMNGIQPEAFAVTSAGVLEYNLFRNGAGSGWKPLPGGGRYLSAPATVTDSAGRLEVFARTTSKTIVRYYQSAPGTDSWYGPETIGTGQFTGDPSVVNWPGRGLVVFARRTDGLLGIDSQAGIGTTTSWTGWHSFGTVTVGQPVAVANFGDGHPEVFAIASGSGSLVHAYNQGSGWKGWNPMPQGGPFTGIPAVAKDATGRVELLVGTTTGYLQSFWQENAGWGPWNTAYIPFGSDIVDTPELISVGGQLEVFAERADGILRYSTQLQADTADWSPWVTLPGPVSGEPAVVYDPSSGRTDILAGVGGSICDRYSVGTSDWSAWRPIGGAS